MNKVNQYIFNIYHYLLNLRDTLEYCIDRKHDKKIYDQRKTVLIKGIEEGTPLGNFLKDNKEHGEEIKSKISEFLDAVYGNESTILKVSGDEIRVDHTQHLRIYEFVSGLVESLKDILNGYFNFAKERNEFESEMFELSVLDDRLYRLVFTMLTLRDFEKSFGEFQKAMAETQGKPSAASNYIVNNEILHMSKMLRFVRDHHRYIDTESCELLDEVNAVLEMTEGRRERKDGKSFKEIFDAINAKINTSVGKVEPTWKEKYNKVFQDAIASNKEVSENAQA